MPIFVTVILYAFFIVIWVHLFIDIINPRYLWKIFES